MGNGIELKSGRTEWDDLIIIGGIAAILQLGYVLFTMLVSMPVTMMSGQQMPVTAQEWFTMINQDPVLALCFIDFPMYIFMFLMYFTSFAFYCIFKRKREGYSILLTALVFLSVTLGLAKSDVFSLFHLSSQYAEATTDAVRQQLLAAGEAVIASNVWNSTAGYFMGIMMLAPLLIYSIMMLDTPYFKKRTAYVGILAIGLDLFQHIIHIFAIDIAATILVISGIFYIPLFLFIGLDMVKMGGQGLDTYNE
ncbi:MAG: hypothetical protein GF411_13780 [Candidatus Lokiarchaeota archaeon]|nr:hypothetical protein [Candidatus Lokiarchaeota archaeon]